MILLRRETRNEKFYTKSKHALIKFHVEAIRIEIKSRKILLTYLNEKKNISYA